MLKIEELRKGNLLYFNDNLFEGQKNKIVEIEKVNQNFIIDKTNKNSILGEIENYKPIEMNEKIFLKLGFDYEYKLLDGIKYVHEFQNIYFLLTSKELKINLSE